MCFTYCQRVFEEAFEFSFVRASEKAVKTIISDSMDVLKCKRDGCFFGGPTRRRSVVSHPALPRRDAACRPSATARVIFGLLA